MPGLSPLSARRPFLAVVAVAAALCVLPSTAGADSLLSTTVSAGSSAYRECASRAVAGTTSVVSRQVAAPMSGIVSAKLNAAGGDWDLAIFESATGRTVGGSAGFNSVEVASGFIGRAATLTVQACRLSGSTGSASLNVAFAAVPTGSLGQRAQLVSVKTPTPFHKDLLNLLDLDVTEHGRSGFVDVVLYGNDDADLLRQAGLQYDVVIPDLAARDRANARQDIAFAAATTKSPLPSGIDAYRHLWEYEYALKELARHYPTLALPITLPFKTNEGREVQGVEIAPNAKKQRDGRPVFLQMGVHHAREWPSGEHAMEFGFDLAMNYGKDPRITSLVDKVRTIVVPIVNPDGFNLSREAPVDLRDVTGVGYDNDAYAYMTLAEPFFAYKRRNCRPVDGAAVTCADLRAGAVPLHRHRPEPQLRRLLGRPGRELAARVRHLSRSGSVLRARDAQHPRPDLQAPGHDADHQPHVQQPRAAAAGHPRPGPAAGRAASTRTSATAWPARTAT